MITLMFIFIAIHIIHCHGYAHGRCHSYPCSPLEDETALVHDAPRRLTKVLHQSVRNAVQTQAVAHEAYAVREQVDEVIVAAKSHIIEQQAPSSIICLTTIQRAIQNGPI